MPEQHLDASVEDALAKAPPDWREQLIARFLRNPCCALAYVNELEAGFTTSDAPIDADAYFGGGSPFGMLENLSELCPHHAEPIIDTFAKPHGDAFQRAVYYRFARRTECAHRREGLGLVGRRPVARSREHRARPTRRTRATASATRSSDDGPSEPSLEAHGSDGFWLHRGLCTRSIDAGPLISRAGCGREAHARVLDLGATVAS